MSKHLEVFRAEGQISYQQLEEMARQMEFKIELTEEEFNTTMEGPCYYTGRTDVVRQGCRKNQELGFTKENFIAAIPLFAMASVFLYEEDINSLVDQVLKHRAERWKAVGAAKAAAELEPEEQPAQSTLLATIGEEE